MREILFRGKDMYGKWHYGAYGVLGENTDIERHVILESTFSQGYFDRFYFKNIEVDPETVGQFTGITDKNGVKIFEGDIVRHDDYSDGACFGFKQKTSTDVVNIEHLMRGCTSLQGLPSHTIETAEITIVGNIFDNPELLNQK